MRSGYLGLAFVGALALSACDGGSDPTPAPSPTPTPANRAPTITSAATVSVAENATGTIYTAAATDPDNNPLSFSISGGDDRAAFQISAAGALSFVASPNFESPTDADRNNVYRVTIAASDGSLSANLDLSVTVTNTDDGIRVRRVATGFPDTVRIRAAHRTETGLNDPSFPPRIYIAQRNGVISLFKAATSETKTFLDMRGRTWVNTTNPTSTPSPALAVVPDGGLLDFGVASSGDWTVSYTNTDGNVDVRMGSTFRSSNLYDTPNTNFSNLLLTVAYPAGATRFGGKLAWWYAGGDKLYVGFGDGGVGANAQDPATSRGKLLRYDGTATVKWTTIGSGLRNPAVPFYQPDVGMLFPDHGATLFEEVNLVRGTDAGTNYGWPFWEGTQRIADGGPASPTPPVLQYPRGTGTRAGSSIVGGAVYLGTIPALANRYIFADQTTGNIWAVPLTGLAFGSTLGADSFEVLNADLVPDQGTIEHPTAIGSDLDGNLYIADADGELFMVTPA